MKRFTSFTTAIAFLLSTPAFAQQPATADTARTDTVVKQAMRTYQQGLDGIKEAVAHDSAGHELGRAARAAARRSGDDRAREESRHSSREARAAIG